MASIQEQLTNILTKLDAAENPFREQALAAMRRCVDLQKPLELLSFTCSTINAPKLFSETPWEYVSLDPTGNNLEADLSALQNILKSLQKIYPVRLKILIGNTDPYYIYLQQFTSIPEEKRRDVRRKFEERWAAYRAILEAWIQQRLPEQEVEVVSWQAWEYQKEAEKGISFEREFSTVYKDLDRFFSQTDLDWEYRKLITQFEPGTYFSGLTRPSDTLLKDWIRRKFAQYAVQGRWLQTAYPDAILIQNEKPSRLRSAMYQPLLQQTNLALPILYFFGIDEQGYA